MYQRILIKKRKCRREGLRLSEDDLMLEVLLSLKKTYASQSFGVCAPVLWKRLPYNIRNQIALQEWLNNSFVYNRVQCVNLYQLFSQ